MSMFLLGFGFESEILFYIFFIYYVFKLLLVSVFGGVFFKWLLEEQIKDHSIFTTVFSTLVEFI